MLSISVKRRDERSASDLAGRFTRSESPRGGTVAPSALGRERAAGRRKTGRIDDNRRQPFAQVKLHYGCSRECRRKPCQGWGRGFESRRPLSKNGSEPRLLTSSGYSQNRILRATTSNATP
jgi:hypothetical protein